MLVFPVEIPIIIIPANGARSGEQRRRQLVGGTESLPMVLCFLNKNREIPEDTLPLKNKLRRTWFASCQLAAYLGQRWRYTSPRHNFTRLLPLNTGCALCIVTPTYLSTRPTGTKKKGYHVCSSMPLVDIRCFGVLSLQLEVRGLEHGRQAMVSNT